MKPRNLRDAKAWFEVPQTSERTQTAVMRLAPGKSSGSNKEGHRASDQVLLVLEGEVIGEIGDDTITMSAGDVVIIPAGTAHRFSNRSSADALTFNTYSPPEYAEKG